MKLRRIIPRVGAGSGYLLVECLVYLSVIVVILGLGLGDFYVCWDYSKALRYATDDINAALHAGERWRADVRGATGKIAIETTPEGEVLRIPCGTGEIRYRFNSDGVRRQAAASDFSELLLPQVKASHMEVDNRRAVSAWRWDLELISRRKETHLPLMFTFEAVARTSP